MKTKDLLTITSVAVGTAALTVATFWAGPIGAGADGDTPAKVPQPRLVSHGAEFTLTAKDGRVFQAGDEPVFELRATNTTQQATSVQVRIVMLANSAPNTNSRLFSLPGPLWQEERKLTLNPGEAKAFDLATKTKLPRSRMISVLMKEVDPASEPPEPANQLLEVRQLGRVQTDNVVVWQDVPSTVFFGGGVVALSFPTIPIPATPRVASVK